MAKDIKYGVEARDALLIALKKGKIPHVVVG